MRTIHLFAERLSTMIRKPVDNKFFIYVFLLNLLSGLAYLHFQNNAFSIACIILLSAFIAYAENCIFCLIRPNIIRRIYSFTVIVIHNAMAITEYFLLANFGLVISHETIDIIADTNPIESANFIETYINLGTILVYAGSCIVANTCIMLLSRVIFNIRYRPVALALSSLGLFLMLYCGYGFAEYHNGMGIPQMSTATRAAYAVYFTHQKAKQNDVLRTTCENLKVKQTIGRKPTVLVIIGESFSVYRSSLYGYDKSTNPLLAKWHDSGNLFLFDNAVTLYAATTASMYADFSLDSLGVDFADKALFPACFKQAKYYTAMYDNQYFAGQGLSFICDRKLSETLFDYRNTARCTYDEDMIKSIRKNDKSPSLYVVHLWGQHYTYKDRFPQAYAKFTAQDYNGKIPQEQRSIMANYDNATLYNDHVVNAILEMFKDDYCYAFYFSDHGEEVYELRNFMGHGSAEHSPNPNYQLRVPLMVWLSPSFKAANPNLTTKLSKAKHYPICTDDIGHTIIDMSGITCKDFVPTRSFINDRFNHKRHRMVMNSVDYDAELINKR